MKPTPAEVKARAALLWSAAKAAAERLQAVGYAGGYVQAGVGLPVEVVEEMARLAGEPLRIRVYREGVHPHDWIALYSITVGDFGTVRVHAQGYRPATPEEIDSARSQGGESVIEAAAGGAQ